MGRHCFSEGLDLFRQSDVSLLILGAHPAMLRCLGKVERLKGAGLGLHRGVEHRAEHDHHVRRYAIDASIWVPCRTLAAKGSEMVGYAFSGQVGQSDVSEVVENVVLEYGAVRHDGRR